MMIKGFHNSFFLFCGKLFYSAIYKIKINKFNKKYSNYWLKVLV